MCVIYFSFIFSMIGFLFGIMFTLLGLFMFLFDGDFSIFPETSAALQVLDHITVQLLEEQ